VFFDARRLVGAALLLLAACQPLPQPFQPQAKKAPVNPLLVPGADASLVIAPVLGTTAGAELADLVAAALQEMEVPATSRGGSRASHIVQGRVIGADRAAMARLGWRLIDPRGLTVAESEQQVVVAPDALAAGQPAALRRVAAAAAAEIARLAGAVAAPAPALSPVRIGPIEGAPGDGANALAQGLKVALGRRGVPLAEAADAGALAVAAAVRVRDAGSGIDAVEIEWTLSRPDGTSLATVAQRNGVPRGRLDGPWGMIAAAAAEAAADGLAEAVRRYVGRPGAAADRGRTSTR
jgi:hypothetical protein